MGGKKDELSESRNQSSEEAAVLHPTSVTQVSCGVCGHSAELTDWEVLSLSNELEPVPDASGEEPWSNPRHRFYAIVAAVLLILLLADVVVPLIFLVNSAKGWKIFDPVAAAVVVGLVTIVYVVFLLVSLYGRARRGYTPF
ncbi:hypothetical protein HPB50_004853 [Hyalomma asiaticum]|uniref:Uncharacterized protein n=1 Tax=Hyalomma asiaticum TaxID=266040 RepID=A0ACB7SCN0_HYAAI|nr:hypothetical protein HPB50_004853 [Hyalomma asiaticum]